MISRIHNVANARSPGTPVCHPDDQFMPLTDDEVGGAAYGRGSA